MAFKTFVDTVALPASDLNTYLMKQAVIVCTSGTRPSSPNEGMPIYETDTDKLLIYTTATTLWVPPWNLPWGRVGDGTATTSQGSITTTVDLTGLTTTFTAVANRRYRAMLHTTWQSTVAGDVAATNIYAGATPYSYGEREMAASANGNALDIFGFFTAPSGSLTVKATGGRAAGTGTLGVQSSSTNQSWLIVEDVGPSSAPA